MKEVAGGELIPWEIMRCCTTDAVDIGFDAIFGGSGG